MQRSIRAPEPTSSAPAAQPDAEWYRALDLAERLSLARSGEPPATGALTSLAEKRLDLWRRQPPFEDIALWRERLRGVTDEDLLRLLAEPPEALRDRQPETPPWLAEVEEAYADTTPWPDIRWPEVPDRPKPTPFLALIEPLVRRGIERLETQVARLRRRHGTLPFDESAIDALLSGLSLVLGPLLTRALVVELQIARLEERLAGDTPEARFQSFVASLHQPETALQILRCYPVMARLVVRQVERWEAAVGSFLEHLAQDAEELARTFHQGRLIGRLTETLVGAGDFHRGGRSVVLLAFDTGLRLVYKPRSLRVDTAFQELLRWTARHGFEPGLRTLAVLERPDHGWVEHVAAEPCQEDGQVERFYRRQGALLALLHLLQGTDFHHENLIAAGEHPVLIDLETLFQPLSDNLRQRKDAPEPGPAARALADTVLRTGLLPFRTWGGRESDGVDLSGLAFEAGGLTPQPVLTVAERDTDRMRFERRRIELPESSHQPRLDGQQVSVARYRDQVLAGFCRMSRQLLDHREELLSHDGPLTGFADAEVRVLFRETQSYGVLLFEQYHPHLLNDALERERFLDRLWAGVDSRPVLRRVIEVERRELADGDVPYFTTRPDSRHVWAGDGERFDDLLAQSGLAHVRDRLETLSKREVERQEWIVRGALATVPSGRTAPRTTYLFEPTARPAGSAELLARARRLADRLLELALGDEREMVWLNPQPLGDGGFGMIPTGPDLYLGLPGIALFLGYLGHVAGQERYSRAARAALAAQRAQIAEDPARVTSLGGFNGWGGVIYALTLLGSLWRDEALFDEAAGYLPDAGEIARDVQLDLIGGAAGCALALLPLARLRSGEAVETALRRCGERLAETARQQPRGVGWVVEIAGPTPLAGISHGAAGIALALLRLGEHLSDDRLTELAHQALEYERCLYDPGRGNWPDLRAEGHEIPGLAPGEKHFMCAWCHGAAGIGLARLAGLPLADDPAIREEIELAVETTRREGFGQNHSLCHGDLGNLELLLAAARHRADPALHEEVYRCAGGILESLDRQGPLSGLPQGREDLGLMVGLTGTGYALTRLAAPDLVPSVLTLEPHPESTVVRPARVAPAAPEAPRAGAPAPPIQRPTKQGETS